MNCIFFAMVESDGGIGSGGTLSGLFLCLCPIEKIKRWSLGAVLFEMLVGYPPFYADEPITTCRKIVHWKNHLKFPEEARLSPEAKDLICRLLCNPENRLGVHGTEQIKAHPWFRDIEWGKLYEMDAAYKPEVNGDLDTQNFIKFDEVNPPPEKTGSGHLRKSNLTSQDLSFIGYTYKNFEAVKGLHYSLDIRRSISSESLSAASARSDSEVDYSRKCPSEHAETPLSSSAVDATSR